MRRNRLSTMLAMPLVALGLTLTGCVDEKIVYRDRDLFETPPAGAAGFVGYSNAETKLTVCGNCHMGQQALWQQTAHAGAWEGLQSSSHAQAFCEGCHTVNALGNIADGNGGWLASQDARYKDVQCESCHGPGLEHVQNPSKATVGSVLAPMAIGTADAWQGCAQCHAGAHHPYADEWKASAHGSPTASPQTRAECVECHTAENALLKFGINANYHEKAEFLATNSVAKNMAITCAVCHDPHATHGAPGQLRKSLTEADLSKNLCMKCHYKRGVPDPTTFRGPHAPEGPVILGEGGWWSNEMMARFPSGKVESTHGSPNNNPKLCAGCHMNQFQYADATSGQTITSTGHTFEAIPCLDENGKPVVKGTCGLTSTERTFQTCTGAGCHGSEGVARSATATVELRIQALTAELDRTLQQINSNWRTCRNNSSCASFRGAPSPFNFVAGSYNSALGAAFNYDMGVRKSASIHNPLLVEALLITSIIQVRKDYDLTTSSTVDLTPKLTQH
ncbi:MAG TPA: multiheme c-type cytochrome [Longimicrobiales bacterium]|nr:multiheme c-type cytochrome [Longimicrobiales bacterium]